MPEPPKVHAGILSLSVPVSVLVSVFVSRSVFVLCLGVVPGLMTRSVLSFSSGGFHSQGSPKCGACHIRF